ncbi:MAG: tetratricopeptide repeat protein [Spirochaetes bacterium]|nr:tetratricopeptide repeat protein [Spirochaetota bacterium]
MKKKRLVLFLILFLVITFLSPLVAKDTLKSALELHKGADYYNKKQYHKALKQFELSIKYDTGNSDAYFWKGITLYQLKQYKQAKKYLLKAANLDPKKGTYEWLHYTCLKLGQSKESEKYKQWAKNPPVTWKTFKTVPIEEKYHKEALDLFNFYQKLLGNEPTIMDNKLNNAAKAHAEYLAYHFFNKPITTQWHYQERGKKGFIGKNPIDQARAFGFNPSEEYFVGNTTGGWSTSYYTEPVYLIEHLVSTIYHRSMVVSPHFEGIGFYRLKKGKKYILVYFYSVKIMQRKENAQAMAYPAEGQTNIPINMLPELPDPFPRDKNVGFPVTVQNFTQNDKGTPVLIEAYLKTINGKTVPFYTLTPESKGMAGQLMGSMKMVCIAAKDPLKKNTEYQAYMKVKDKEGRVIFDKKWNFKTGNK